MLLGVGLALWAPAIAAAKDWWVLNAAAARCDDAKATPYASPEAFRNALIRTHTFQDMQVFRDNDNNVKGAMLVATNNISLYYFVSRELCELTLQRGMERGFIGKPGELE